MLAFWKWGICDNSGDDDYVWAVMLRKVKTVRKQRPKNGIRDARHALHVAPVIFSSTLEKYTLDIEICKLLVIAFRKYK